MRLTRYEETYGTITFIYKFVPMVIAPRTFSKLKLVAALQAEGLRSAVRDWLIEVDLEDLSLAAQNFREDYPAFAAALDAAKSRFHLTNDQTATGPAVIQCKFHTHPVGYDAVQQAYTAKALYKATAAYVVTNATYTPQARRARL